MRLTTVAIVAGLVMASGLAGAEDVYRWVDKSGKVVYSQIPPDDDVAGEWVKVKAPSPNKQATEDTPKPVEEKVKGNPALDKELRKEYCQAGRQNLKVLEVAKPGDSLMTADKKLVEYSAEEIEQKIQETKAVIKAYCDDEDE